MKKDHSKDAVLVVNQYNRVIIARYQSVEEASKALDIPKNAIWYGLSTGRVRYECYWVWASQIDNWEPAPVVFRRVRELKTPEKLKKLLDK